MKKYILLLALPFLFGCKSLKTVKIFKKGEVAISEFKTEVPFEFRLGLIILKVEVNGKLYDFVLDTGAPNVISTELAKELNIESAVNQKAKDSQGGKSELGFAEIPDIAIGGLHFTRTGAAIADLRQSAEIACLKVDGFIGANLMRKAVWHFDYQKQVITITNDKSKLDVPADAKQISFRQQLTGTPLIDIEYNGVTDQSVTFDLGSNGNIASSSKTLKEISRKEKIRTNYGYGNSESGLFGQGAGDTTVYGIVPIVKFGDIELKDQVVSFSPQKARTIGTKVFEHYRVIIDWSEEEITMVPVTEYSYSELKTTGISPQFNDSKLFVGFLHHGSSAEKQGISVGDQILEINGKDYRTCTADQWCEILEDGFLSQDGETSTLLILKNGEEKHYVISRVAILK